MGVFGGFYDDALIIQWRADMEFEKICIYQNLYLILIMI